MDIDLDNEPIHGFFGKYRFLSNFYSQLDPIAYNYIRYPTVEHAFQAQKSTKSCVQLRIAQLPKPKYAKAEGKRIQIRSDWDQVKDDIMLQLIRLKFSQPRLKEMLLDTGNRELVEMNGWGDTYWGTDTFLEGENRLGKILMTVRDELKQEPMSDIEEGP